MKKNTLLSLALLLMSASAFGMEPAKPTIAVSLGHWKNDTNSNLLINQETMEQNGSSSSEQNIAKLPAKTEVNLKKEIQLSKSITAGPRVSGFYDAFLNIRDPQNPDAQLMSLSITYEARANRIEVRLVNSVKTGRVRTYPGGFSFPEWHDTELDHQSYDRISPSTNIVIQGTIRGDNFSQSKIELLGQEK